MSDSNAMWDIYGNMYGPDTAYTNLPLNLNITSSTSITNPIWTGGSITAAPPYTIAPHSIDWLSNPSQLILQPDVMENVFEKMVTVVKPGEKVVVCVDQDLTSGQMREVTDGLADRGFDGIVLRGARAGTGFAGNPQNMTREETRVDTLARILELWQQRPELKLTSLLEWYHGEEMNDEDFAAAVEVHFQKVTNEVRGKP
jgi:hypothetical protein